MSAVNARRPAIYLAVAAVLSRARAAAAGARAGARAAARGADRPSRRHRRPPPPACTGLRGSLRPDGPLPPPGAMPPDSTMAVIAGRGRLIAGVDQGNYRLGYRNPLTGELAGADIDLAHRIAAAIFGDPNRVQFVVLDIAERATAIQDGQVDVVVNSFTVTCARQRVVEFSSAYMAVSQRMLVPVGSGVREVEDLAGKRVCTSRGSTTEDVLRGLPLAPQRDHVPRACRAACWSCSAVGWPRCPATTWSWPAWPRRIRRPRSSGARSATTSTRSASARPRPTWSGSSTRVLEQGRVDGSLAASYRFWFGDYVNPVPRPPPARYRD